MLKKVIIAAAVAAFLPVVAQAAPAHSNHKPSHQTSSYHKHGPKIVYKTVFQTKKVVKIVKVHGRFVKVVRYVKVPVKMAFINGRPMHRM